MPCARMPHCSVARPSKSTAPTRGPTSPASAAASTWSSSIRRSTRIRGRGCCRRACRVSPTTGGSTRRRRTSSSRSRGSKTVPPRQRAGQVHYHLLRPDAGTAGEEPRTFTMLKLRVVYPGTFDPFTRGHKDIVRRAAKLFDRGHRRRGRQRSAKDPFFATGDRVAMTREVLADVPERRGHRVLQPADGLRPRAGRARDPPWAARRLRLRVRVPDGGNEPEPEPRDRDLVPDSRREIHVRLGDHGARNRLVRRRRLDQFVHPLVTRGEDQGAGAGTQRTADSRRNGA